MTHRDLTILGCSSQQPTRLRNHGAYLVRWNGEGFLFDPGEGTQRQFIWANVAPTCVQHIFVSHFHGDHCLGLGSMLMRLNLDKVSHEIHCYYPKQGETYFERLRYGTIYHENIRVVPHPIENEGIVRETDTFTIEARFLEHGVPTLGWRITEKDRRKFYKEKLNELQIKGPAVRTLIQDGFLDIEGKRVTLDDVSWIRKGDSIAVVIDTLPCENAYLLAKEVALLLCESTYLDNERTIAANHNHLTALQAADIAKKSQAKKMVLTHFSARYLDEEAFATEARTVFKETFAAKDLKKFRF